MTDVPLGDRVGEPHSGDFFVRKEPSVLTLSNRLKCFIVTTLLIGAAVIAGCDTGAGSNTLPTPVTGAPAPITTAAATSTGSAPQAVPTGGDQSTAVASPVATAGTALTPTATR